MTPKKINTLYWIFTSLFALLMIFSAVGGIQPSEDAIKLVHDQLGYPVYFIPFISVAKIIGSIVLLIPGLNRIKEWAYAGLFFDLVAAVYSGLAVNGFDPLMLTLAVWFGTGILSYYYWHKK
ncbi:MAG TPA: hypothetical protein DGG95_13805 [Cytophagales bacterium]|jgi:hypothetical protein|nr:hypothetical protein [Cytophagales bacterium]